MLLQMQQHFLFLRVRVRGDFVGAGRGSGPYEGEDGG